MTKAKLKKIGDRYKNFQLKRLIALPEIQCQLFEVVHLPTNASILHINNDDEENVFCLSFQTTPTNSSGVAHILEHTVLCGSKKYPVKDPFFAMSRRSLNTFMNAFTGADFTCYPAASQVRKDFYNLLEVYLDAIFHPRLLELSFGQEGHRLEFANPKDPNSPLEIKGIVFNEMKGALATPDARLSEGLDTALFPDVTYGFNSGGNPKEIRELTYQQLLDFHKKHYHPSHCLFYFYGNLPLEGHLDFLQTHVLNGVKKQIPLERIPLQKRYKEPLRKTLAYPYFSQEDLSDKSLIAFAWLTCHVLEQDILTALTVLTTALCSTDASPLKKALLESGMCKQAIIYIVDDYSEIPVVITLKGCKKEDAEKLEVLIREVLEKIARTNIPAHLIESAMHQIEFHRSEITGNHLPYGLNLFMRSSSLKQHGGNPEDALLVHSLFNRLRVCFAKDPEYFPQLIKKYFLDNTHFVSVLAKPDNELAAKEAVEEKAFLNQVQKELDHSKRGAILEQAKALEQLQRGEESKDLTLLPKVTLKDVPEQGKDFLLQEETAGALKVYSHECFTNQIIYAALTFPLPAIEEKELSLLKLFTFILPQMGCGGRSYTENLEYIQAYTGGVGAKEALSIQAKDFDAFSPYFAIQGKALFRDADKLLKLFKDMAESADFTDLERIKMVLTKHFSALNNSLNRKALGYAITLAASGLSQASRIGQAWNGLEYYSFIRNLVETLDLEKLSQNLKRMKDKVLCLKNPHLVITADQEMLKKLRRQKFFGLQDIATRPFEPWQSNYSLLKVPPQGRVIASPVAFTSQVLRSIPYVHPDSPALSVVAELFDNLTLHRLLREQGGAYGGGAQNHSLSGHFCFYAYRDPNIFSTLKAFEEAVQSILNQQFKQSDLEEAKLEVIQSLDSPIAPGSRATVAYEWLREGKPHEVRQAFRQRLLTLNKSDVQKAVQTHILPSLEKANTVVFASQVLLEKENKLMLSQGKDPLKIEKI